ncbi:MAG: hypothetical protein ACLQU2_33250 [Candidatus Binataceae bacterium]
MGSQDINPHAAALAGRCLAAGQQVYTARGAVAVEVLAKGGGFEAVCFDRNARCFVARAARASAAGRKPAVRLHTDKGSFALSSDQPALLEDGQICLASELTPGTRLRACTVKPELGNLVTSADVGKERIDLSHVAAADCAVANWYPVPSVDALGDLEVYQVEIESGTADDKARGAANFVAWTTGPGGGIGIVILV